MSCRVLVVTSEIDLASRLNKLLSDHKSSFEFTLVENRKEATAVLSQESFELVITSLKIPRITDGYLFLTQLVDTDINSKKVIVVDEKTDSVITSIKSRGVAHIYLANDLKIVKKALIEETGKTSSNDEVQETITDATFDLEKIKTVLNNVMGPVGKMIFTDVVGRWQDHDDLSELLQLIKTEINDQEKIDLFQEHLH
jgi:DNA-binding NtrC family response regulator